MRPVSNNRRPLHWPQLIFAARCCGFLRKTGRCVSAVLRADDSSRAQQSSSGGRSSGQAWRVCSKEQCGKSSPIQRWHWQRLRYLPISLLLIFSSLHFVLLFGFIHHNQELKMKISSRSGTISLHFSMRSACDWPELMSQKYPFIQSSQEPTPDSVGPEEHSQSNTVTHLKLLLLAGGSFSQALCSACSLLSWSWMLQNDGEITQCLNVNVWMKDVEEIRC